MKIVEKQLNKEVNGIEKDPINHPSHYVDGSVQ